LAANQKAIKHLAYTGHVVQPVHPIHTTAYLYGKREAEAEPAAEAEADPALLVSPYTGAWYNGAHQLVNPLSHVHQIPAVVNQVVKPVVTYNGLTTPVVSTPVVKPVVTYNGLTTPVVSTPVVNTVATKTVVHPLYDTTHVVHLGKREAEAEADPSVFYGNYPAYTGYPGYTYGLTYAYNPSVYGYGNMYGLYY